MPPDGVWSLSYEGPADPGCIDRIHHLVHHLWSELDDAAQSDRDRFETAVIEVAGNVVEHAGPQVRLRLRLTAHPDRVEADLRDDGAGLEQPDVVGRPVDRLAEHGRGIALARAAVDELAYERVEATNCWRIVQRRRTSCAAVPT